MGCLLNLFKIFLGLIVIIIMLVAGYKLVFEPYHPFGWSQKDAEAFFHQDTSHSMDKISYDVPMQTGPTHDYIMDNTFQKPFVRMELDPELEKGLVYVIKAFKAVFGQDFSPEMRAIAQQRMPKADLYLGDLTQGLALELAGREYDCIVATYSLHHLTDGEKVRFLRALQARLRPGGEILIGDVAFDSRTELEACRAAAGETWDDGESYPVAEELRRELPGLRFQRMSPCAGVLLLKND